MVRTKSDDATVVGPLKIRYRGVYDLAGLLSLIYNWFMLHQYDYDEPNYKDKIETPFGNEIEVKMNGTKKVTEYYMTEVYFYIHCWESKEVVVKTGNKETKMMKGRFEVTVKGGVVRDWQDRFKGPVWEKAQKFMDNVVLKNEFLVKYADSLDKEVHALNTDIKRFLKIEAY